MNRFLHHVHHLLVPRESNNHRPKVLHHDSLFFLIAVIVLVGSLFGFVNKTHPDVLGISSDISAQELLDLTNQKRAENGLAPLVLDGQLSAAAQQKGEHMFANNYWAHIAPDGTTPWYFIKNAGYEYLYAGENLARGFSTASGVVDAWMASPTHRDNMLSENYRDVGFSIQTGNLTGTETILVVEELGSRYETQSEVVQAVVTQSTPTPVPVVGQVVTPTVIPSVTPVISPAPVASEQSLPVVAAVVNQPFFDRQSLTKTIALVLVGLLIVVLIIDAIIIERKKIARVVSHNLDHILFLLIILLVIIIISRGLIL